MILVRSVGLEKWSDIIGIYLGVIRVVLVFIGNGRI